MSIITPNTQPNICKGLSFAQYFRFQSFCLKNLGYGKSLKYFKGSSFVHVAGHWSIFCQLLDFLNSCIALEGDAVMGMGTDLQDWFPSH